MHQVRSAREGTERQSLCQVCMSILYKYIGKYNKSKCLSQMNRDSSAIARPAPRRSRSPSPARRSRSPSPARRSRSPSPARRSRSPSPARRGRSRSLTRKVSVGSSAASTARMKKRRVAPVPVHSAPSASAQNAHRTSSTARTKKRRVEPVSVQVGSATDASSVPVSISSAASATAAPGNDPNTRIQMLRTIQRTLTQQMDSLQTMFGNASPLNKHGQPKPRTARQVRDNLQGLKTELGSFMRACDTLAHTIGQLESHDAAQKASEEQRLASIQAIQIPKGPYKGYWRCSEADSDLVCRGGPNHGGRFGFRPTTERKKVTRHIKTQHLPRKTEDGYRSLDWVD